MRPFESRLWPIQRSQRSFFDSPSWDMAPMSPLPRSNEMSLMARDYPTAFGQMEQHMRDMDRRMDEMFRSFHSLRPMDSAMGPMPSGALSSMPSPPAMPNFGQMMPMQPMQELKIDNPYVTDKDGNRKLKLDFDVRQFTPEEIQVKTQDRQLCVHAKHEEKGEHGQVYREYQRYFLLPDNLEPERLSSVLSPDGVLSIEAPMPALEAPKKTEISIPITHNKAA